MLMDQDDLLSVQCRRVRAPQGATLGSVAQPLSALLTGRSTLGILDVLTLLGARRPSGASRIRRSFNREASRTRAVDTIPGGPSVYRRLGSAQLDPVLKFVDCSAATRPGRV